MTSSTRVLVSPASPYAGVVNPRVEWVQALLKHISQYCDEADRDRVIGAVCQASAGSTDGLILADEWYRRRDDYPGDISLLFKWKAFEHEPTCADGFAVLCEMVEERGFDPLDICGELEPEFVPCDYTVVEAEEKHQPEQEPPVNALARYSLKGHREVVARTATDQIHVLGRLALSNQLTAIYGAPGVGKSLIVMSLIIDAITRGVLDPAKIFSLDFDTNPTGLLEKLDIAETYGFNMLSDGYLELTSRKFIEALDGLIADGQAHGVLVILDTLKKFTSIMDKDRSSSFANRLRRFSKAGGTCIALAHVNKHPTSEGKPIYAGTTDILEDFDCAYLLYEIGVDVDARTKTVLFENIKSRGDVAKQASYRYSIAEGLAYSELVDSVGALDEAELLEVQSIGELRADESLIEAVGATIRSGVVAKMELVAIAAKRGNVSRRTLMSILDKYCGTDPTRHFWNFTVHERGLKKYKLLTNCTMDCGTIR